MGCKTEQTEHILTALYQAVEAMDLKLVKLREPSVETYRKTAVGRELRGRVITKTEKEKTAAF